MVLMPKILLFCYGHMISFSEVDNNKWQDSSVKLHADCNDSASKFTSLL